MRALRDKDELGKWLIEQEWDGVLKQSEKQQLLGIVQSMSGYLKGGVTSLIEAVAGGIGKTIGGG